MMMLMLMMMVCVCAKVFSVFDRWRLEDYDVLALSYSPLPTSQDMLDILQQQQHQHHSSATTTATGRVGQGRGHMI